MSDESEKATVILVENEDIYRDFITPIIEEAGFRVVDCKVHSQLHRVLKATPEARGIISDVDTDYTGAGVDWARHNRDGILNRLPIVFTSVLVYPDAAKELDIPTIPKPFVLPDEPEYGSKGGVLRGKPEFDEVADQFPIKLKAWLAELPERGTNPKRARLERILTPTGRGDGGIS